MSQRPPLRSRTLLIDKNIQIPLLTYTLAMTAVGISLTVLLSSMWSVTQLYFESPLTASVFIFSSSVVIFLIMLFMGLYVSNKVAGPIHRLKRHMTEVADGEAPSPLTTRKNDYIDEELIKEYNRLLERINR